MDHLNLFYLALEKGFVALRIKLKRKHWPVLTDPALVAISPESALLNLIITKYSCQNNIRHIACHWILFQQLRRYLINPHEHQGHLALWPFLLLFNNLFFGTLSLSFNPQFSFMRINIRRCLCRTFQCFLFSIIDLSFPQRRDILNVWIFLGGYLYRLLLQSQFFRPFLHRLIKFVQLRLRVHLSDVLAPLKLLKLTSIVDLVHQILYLEIQVLNFFLQSIKSIDIVDHLDIISIWPSHMHYLIVFFVVFNFRFLPIYRLTAEADPRRD